MVKCPSCFSDCLEDLGDIIICSNCNYKIYKKEIREKEDVEIEIAENKKTVDDNKNAIFIIKILYIFPIMLFFFILIAIGLLSMKEIFSTSTIINEAKISIEIIDKLIIYFFLMLALIDFSILILQEYVRPLVIPTEEPTMEEKCFRNKIYLEKLMIFGMILIILDIFSKIFSNGNDQDIKTVLIGVSIVIISIGIWKYLSFKAEYEFKFKK